MKNTKVLDFLSDILGQYKPYNMEMYFKCPFPDCAGSNKKKLAVNLDSMQWHCWVCNNRGTNLFTLAKRMSLAPDKIKRLHDIVNEGVSNTNINNIQSTFNHDVAKKNDVMELPKEFKSFKDISKNPEYTNAMYYLKGRNISIYDIVKYRMGYCDSGDYHGYIIIPSYNEKMDVNYFIARDYYGRDFRYKNPPASKNLIFNEPCINWSERITICEGVFDAIAVKRNAIPLLGKAINNALRIKILEKKVSDIYLCLDRDAILNSIIYIEEFLKNDINVYLVELTGKDPSALGFATVNKLIKNAKKMDFMELIKLKMSH